MHNFFDLRTQFNAWIYADSIHNEIPAIYVFRLFCSQRLTQNPFLTFPTPPDIDCPPSKLWLWWVYASAQLVGRVGEAAHHLHLRKHQQNLAMELVAVFGEVWTQILKPPGRQRLQSAVPKGKKQLLVLHVWQNTCIRTTTIIPVSIRKGKNNK